MKHDFFRPGMTAESLISSIANGIAVRMAEAKAPAIPHIEGMGRMSHLSFRCALALAFDVGAYMLSRESRGSMCNIYSFEKLECLLNVLAGAAFPRVNKGFPLTIHATLEALCKYDGNNVKIDTLAYFVDDFFNAHPLRAGMKRYSSGKTQTSSAFRALEGLGIVSQEGGCRIVNREAFDYLLRAARGESQAPFVNVNGAAPQEAPESPHEGLVIEGECEEAPAPMLGLPAPEAPAKRPRKGRGK